MWNLKFATIPMCLGFMFCALTLNAAAQEKCKNPTGYLNCVKADDFLCKNKKKGFPCYDAHKTYLQNCKDDNCGKQ